MASVMPTIHPTVSGGEGSLHANDFFVVDAETACIRSAEAQLALLWLLLREDGKRAREIIANYKPRFASMQEYFNYVDSVNRDDDTVAYDGDSTVILKY